MLAGIALHNALEHATCGEFAELSADGYVFVFPENAEIALPVVRELKAEKVYMVGGVAVTVVGKVDTLQGKSVEDHKTTSQFDAEKYMGTFQWRYYLDIFNADHFRWNVFVLSNVDEKVYEVRAVHPLNQYRYPGMADDCMELLREFVDFARVNLPERFMAQAA